MSKTVYVILKCEIPDDATLSETDNALYELNSYSDGFIQSADYWHHSPTDYLKRSAPLALDKSKARKKRKGA